MIPHPPSAVSVHLLRDEGSDRHPRPSLRSRVTARVRSRQFDCDLAVGVRPAPRTPLAAHRWRLESDAERRALAATLRSLHSASRGIVPSTVPLDATALRDAWDQVDLILRRLDGDGAVHARGVARLRRLLADGTGPLYRTGQGDLPGRLGAVLAAL